MKFGVRQICNVVFKAKANTKIGNRVFKKGQPVLYIDTATTSTMEGAATTVYAQGGRGHNRLIAWEGEKTLTFTVEDALLSPIGFSVLSGAGLFKGSNKTRSVHVHMTANAYTELQADGNTFHIDLTDALGVNEEIDETAPIFVSFAEEDGSITGTMLDNLVVARVPVVTGDTDEDEVEVIKYKKQMLVGALHNKPESNSVDSVKLLDEEGNLMTESTVLYPQSDKSISTRQIAEGQLVFVDFYVVKPARAVSEIQIDASNFAGYYYVEASTLYRRQNDGVDMPAELTFPNVKIQSNFTFTMASNGDPSTFTFTMDAFPGYTLFDRKHKVLCVMQIIEDVEEEEEPDRESVMPHETGFAIPEDKYDSVITNDKNSEGSLDDDKVYADDGEEDYGANGPELTSPYQFTDKDDQADEGWVDAKWAYTVEAKADDSETEVQP